jgi:RNA polymerase sigma-70 factor, ECF subfamily
VSHRAAASEVISIGGEIVQQDSSNGADTERLLMRIRSGDRDAFDELFERHREQLRRAVELRLTPALKARFDASDVVQEAHLEAYRRLDDYLARDPMPFGIWIRRTAQQRLQKLKRTHLHTQLRSVNREQAFPDQSSMMIASRFLSPATSVNRQLAKREYEELVQSAVSELEELDREILLMRIVEGLAHSDIAQILEVTSDVVRQRYGRALIKLEQQLAAKGLSRSQP